jgi:hypothetical protein
MSASDQIEGTAVGSYYYHGSRSLKSYEVF